VPLDKPKLVADLQAMQQKAMDEKWDPPKSLQALADAIESFVRSGDVLVHADLNLAGVKASFDAKGKVS
jgi:hypothetical protein